MQQEKRGPLARLRRIDRAAGQNSVHPLFLFRIGSPPGWLAPSSEVQPELIFAMPDE